MNGTSRKQKQISKKHGVRFSEALPLFQDDFAITMEDDESDREEQRFISIGAGAKNRIIVAVYCYRGDTIRIISARLADPHEREQYQENR
ncbi:MAG TPA: BrnT family toxin [Acidobacteriaceae bacterium]|nr:BrnT family toxin [Acidobacteriaceae bacterium]